MSMIERHYELGFGPDKSSNVKNVYFEQIEVVKNHMPDDGILSEEDYFKYMNLQEKILEELDKILEKFDYTKDKKINLGLNEKDLFMLIINKNLLKPSFYRSTYDRLYKPIYHSKNKFIDLKYLRMLDLSSINLDGLIIEGMDLSYTNISVNPDKINGNIVNCNFEGMDFKDKDFKDKYIVGTNFKNCKNLNIDPQTVKRKDLSFVNLENIDMSGKNFDNCVIIGSNLKNTNADIDPQKVFLKSLEKTNCESLDLSGKSFDNVDISFANLNYTNANIDPQKLESFDILYPVDKVWKVFKLTKSNHMYLSSLVDPRLSDDELYAWNVKDMVKHLHGDMEGLINYYNEIFYDCVKGIEEYHSLEGTSLLGINFKGKNFDNVVLEGAMIDDCNTKINPQKIIKVIDTSNGEVIIHSFKNATLKNVVFTNDFCDDTILTGSKIIDKNGRKITNKGFPDFTLEEFNEDISSLPTSVRRQVLSRRAGASYGNVYVLTLNSKNKKKCNSPEVEMNFSKENIDDTVKETLKKYVDDYNKGTLIGYENSLTNYISEKQKRIKGRFKY